MYRMMTAKEVVDMLYKMPDNAALYFTFDDCDIFEEGDEPEGWYGVKFTQIFDETDWLFAIGYMGGGSTEVYDIYGLIDNSDNEESVKEFCAEKLQKFMNYWCGVSCGCEKICVEIKED